uniref:SAGA-associated factor 11 n=1 Tax=Macrostomum lignano TaxID=282301 RepID=A0A1I8FF24_9PLAT
RAAAGLRRDGADGGGGSGGGGGLSEESDSGEDNSATKKKKRSSMEDSEGIDPVYSLLKHAADRGTQKCAACCPQSESLSPAGRNSPVCNHAGYSRLADDLTRQSAMSAKDSRFPPGAEQQQQRLSSGLQRPAAAAESGPHVDA